MTETCPSCGVEAGGRFCTACGSALSAACRECGNPLPRGARFCNECGAAAVAPPAAAHPRSHRLPWAVAAATTAALAASLLWPRRTAPDPVPTTSAPAATFSGPTASPGAAAPPDISQMSPRERADRLFDRVMRAAAQGDSGQAVQFAPMAIQAYRMLPERTADDHYHLATLHMVARDPDAARAEADTVLAGNANHLLALFTAAEAEQARDNGSESRRLLQRFLDAYPRESVRRDVPEYQDHAQALPIMRQAAERLLARQS